MNDTWSVIPPNRLDVTSADLSPIPAYLWLHDRSAGPLIIVSCVCDQIVVIPDLASYTNNGLALNISLFHRNDTCLL